MDNRDGDDYVYARRAPGIDAQAVMDGALAHNTKVGTAEARRALLQARREEEDRKQQAILRILAVRPGISDRQLAKALSWSPSMARSVRRRTYERIGERTRDEWQAILLNGCQESLAYWGQKEFEGDLRAARHVLNVREQIARLTGSFETQKIDVTGSIDVSVVESVLVAAIEGWEREAEAIEAQVVELPAAHPAAGQ